MRKMYMNRSNQRGLTLIELLVSMVISLLITLAAVASLVISRQGFTTVDAASQLRDNSRFLQDIIQRLGVQTGFKDVISIPTSLGAPTVGLIDPPPYVFGINNSSRTKNNTWDEGTTRTSSSVGYGSDILVLRYQASKINNNSNLSDGAMIDCSGTASLAKPEDANDNLISILHVGISSDGEPSLMCSRSANGTAPYDTQPLIRGVENFQVLYGVDGIGPGNTTVPIPVASADSVPERFLRANQLTIASNEAATYANWQRVRSIRIGMVLRAPPNSAIEQASQTYYPLGVTMGSGSIGSAFADSTNDAGTVFTPALDGRMRQTVTFTVHLRNYQGID